jgi:hypothetical protein
MKRILGVLMLLLFITACDDGKLTVDVIDFSEVPVQKCSDKDVLYKVKYTEMLILEIPATTFAANQTIDGAPILVPLSTNAKVTYRRYASAASSLNVCGTLPSATPNLVEEWNATAGTIQITSTAIKNTNTTTGFETITGYTYNIVFINITFQKSNGIDQIYPEFPFGNYTKTESALAFGFNEEVDKSTCSTKIYDFSGGEVFTLDVADYATLFANVVTLTPRTALISATNTLSYRLYSNAITNAYFCATTTPATPTLTQQWDAVNGIEATSGIIEVTTIPFLTGFQHTIHLKNVTLKKGNSDFSLGNDYLFGTLVTN